MPVNLLFSGFLRTLCGSLFPAVENNSYFTYFSEIEDRFCQRRGTILILSTLDWALIETWKDAGIPLEAVLRGIDDAFDKYDARPRKTQKINSLAYCSQAVLAAAEDMKAAAEGATRPEPTDTGFEAPSVATYLAINADRLASLTAATHTNCDAPHSKVTLPTAAAEIVRDCSRTLRELAASFSTAVPSATNAAPDVPTTTTATNTTNAASATSFTSATNATDAIDPTSATEATSATNTTNAASATSVTSATNATNATSATAASPEGAEFDSPALQCRVPAPTASESRRDGTARRTSLEDLERRLTVMEEKLFAALLAATPDEQLVAVRADADRELAPYRRKMSGPQIEQLHKQYVHKRLLERYNIPRLSLFYMQ